MIGLDVKLLDMRIEPIGAFGTITPVYPIQPPKTKKTRKTESGKGFAECLDEIFKELENAEKIAAARRLTKNSPREFLRQAAVR